MKLAVDVLHDEGFTPVILPVAANVLRLGADCLENRWGWERKGGQVGMG